MWHEAAVPNVIFRPQALSYELRGLRLHALVECLPKSHRFRVTELGLRTALFLPAPTLASSAPAMGQLVDSRPTADTPAPPSGAVRTRDRPLGHWSQTRHGNLTQQRVPDVLVTSSRVMGSFVSQPRGITDQVPDAWSNERTRMRPGRASKTAKCDGVVFHAERVSRNRHAARSPKRRLAPGRGLDATTAAASRPGGGAIPGDRGERPGKCSGMACTTLGCSGTVPPRPSLSAEGIRGAVQPSTMASAIARAGDPATRWDRIAANAARAPHTWPRLRRDRASPGRRHGPGVLRPR
jgi:hypothetical protein